MQVGPVTSAVMLSATLVSREWREGGGRSAVKTSQDLTCTIYNLATISLSRTPEQGMMVNMKHPSDKCV